MISNELHKGDLILALPCIPGDDVSFSRAVVLLTEHDEDASVGYILNKPTNFLLNELINETEGSFTVYNGGPVDQDSLFCLHNRPDIISESLHVDQNLYSGGNFEEIFYLINEGELTNQHIRFYLGYSGWEPNQLQTELDNRYWKKLRNVNHDQLFSIHYSTFWKDNIEKLGGSYKILANAPLDPTFN